jgi:hypothetical protein
VEKHICVQLDGEDGGAMISWAYPTRFGAGSSNRDCRLACVDVIRIIHVVKGRGLAQLALCRGGLLLLLHVYGEMAIARIRKCFVSLERYGNRQPHMHAGLPGHVAVWS